LLALLVAAAGAAEPLCGVETPCRVANGDYLLVLPDDWDGWTPLPAVVFFHGHNASAAAVVGSASLRRSLVDRGYLLIAPNGALLPGRDSRGWPARPFEGEGRDELAFVAAVMADVEQRLLIDRARTLVSGFSSGGSMAWLVACYAGAGYGGFAPVAGGLRRPQPAGPCPAGPLRLLHIHGWADAQVPLEGRGIGNWHQGDVFAAFDILRRTNACTTEPSGFSQDGIYRCRYWRGCGSTDADISFCLHDGGHLLPDGWAELARAWFEHEPD
jgi:polyhydroxybutyrate depolymerase